MMYFVGETDRTTKIIFAVLGCLLLADIVAFFVLQIIYRPSVELLK